MNIYELAMKMEKEGSEFYSKASRECNDTWLKGIFEYLAIEESKHYKIFKDLKDNVNSLDQVDLNSSEEIINAFEKNKKERIIECLTDLQSDVYIAAAKDEQASIDLYEGLLNKSQNEEEKKALSLIIEEEKKHLNFFREVIELMEKIQEQRK
ncbi:rubrerythrin [Clostridium homopropionicum DSM 5847]|uniref:Rubrerythrin n=1 Tax=Clostridium homopropionicum DSM 5847 TaxID=1121318 RepID=A0A0L6ZFB2_9CLOT|nr:ferritin family protein [Clostridium homopropionicum]KOA21473.1 rubrerythrin [Clostridium homopropionicum DSM 5847]SFG08578.1 Rubrerythrin [Clostridium homopropionicum]